MKTSTISTREKLITAAAELMESRGYYGMGINELLKACDVPKGSLYHHFPGGKNELIKEAIVASGQQQIRNFGRAMKGRKTVGTALQAVIDYLIDRLKATNFQYACPVSAVALESVQGDADIRTSCKEAFENLENTFEAYLNLNGIEESGSYAKMVINMIEGGVLLSKAHHDTGHLEEIKKHLPKIIRDNR